MATLPSGYTQLEYIEGTGTQYINTNFYPNQDTGLEMQMEFIDANLSNLAAMFDCRANGLYYGLYKASSSNWNLTFFYGNIYNQFFTINYNTIYTVSIKKNVGTVNDISLTYSYSSFQLAAPLFLLASNESGNPVSITKGKIYYVQLYNGNSLVHDLIPCKNPLGEVGLYDLIGQNFLNNSGTGSFIAGPTIASSNIYVKIGDVWQPVTGIYTKTNNTW